MKKLLLAVAILLLTATTVFARSGRVYLPLVTKNGAGAAQRTDQTGRAGPVDTTGRPSEDQIAQLPICTDEMVAEANEREAIEMTDPANIDNWLCTAKTLESFFPDGRLPGDSGVQTASAQQTTWAYGFSAMSCSTCPTSSGVDILGGSLSVRNATAFGGSRSWNNFQYHNKVVVGAANQTITCNGGQTSIPVIGVGPAQGNIGGSAVPAMMTYWTYFQNYCYMHTTNYWLDANSFHFVRLVRTGSSLWSADFWNGTAWVNLLSHATPFDYGNYFNAGIGVWAQYSDWVTGIDLPVNGTRHMHFRLNTGTTYGWNENTMPSQFVGKSSTSYYTPLATTIDAGGNRTAIDVYVP
jgi:hypothetical protein